MADLETESGPVGTDQNVVSDAVLQLRFEKGRAQQDKRALL